MNMNVVEKEQGDRKRGKERDESERRVLVSRNNREEYREREGGKEGGRE